MFSLALCNVNKSFGNSSLLCLHKNFIVNVKEKNYYEFTSHINRIIWSLYWQQKKFVLEVKLLMPYVLTTNVFSVSELGVEEKSEQTWQKLLSVCVHRRCFIYLSLIPQSLKFETRCGCRMLFFLPRSDNENVVKSWWSGFAFCGTETFSFVFRLLCVWWALNLYTVLWLWLYKKICVRLFQCEID